MRANFWIRKLFSGVGIFGLSAEMHAGMNAALGVGQELQQFKDFRRLGHLGADGGHDIAYRTTMVDAVVGGSDRVNRLLRDPRAAAADRVVCLQAPVAGGRE